MARQDPNSIFTWLGLVIWGDVGDLTMYKATPGHLVIFSKTWPDKPASPLQEQARTRLALAAHDWNRLSGDHRHQWDQAARRASLCMHGYDLFVSFTLRPDPQSLATLARQTGTTLQLTP